MVMVRCAIAADVTRYLRKAVAIAVRYSAVRRQVRTWDIVESNRDHTN